MTTRALRVGLALAVSSVLAIVAGCVDDDPVISGHRTAADSGATPTNEAGASDSGPPVINTIVPLDDLDGGNDAGDIDDPKCRHCQTTLDPEKPRGTLCRHNNVNGTGLSSVETLNALVNCLCYDKCPSKCGNYCSGGKNDLICTSCTTQGCGEFVAACSADL